MNKFFKGFLSFMCCIPFTVSAVACNREKADKPQSRDWVEISTFPKENEENYQSVLSAYLQPVWYTKEVYDETALVVGQNGKVTLLYEPDGEIIVRNYNLTTTYKKDIDYRIEGKTITRMVGGNLPYFETDEYYLQAPNNPSVPIAVNGDLSYEKFGEQRYLWFNEGVGITKNQISISYKTKDSWKGAKPIAKSGNISNFINKIQNDRSATIAFYGDSITVGCNASGTIYGENKNPYLPDWSTLVCAGLSKKFKAEIKRINDAVGGWTSTNGLANYDQSIGSYIENIDLLVLGFGMNDGGTPSRKYRENTEEMINKFFEKNPEGSVILVSSMQPNTESSWVGNQLIFESVLDEISSEIGQTAVAPILSVFLSMEENHSKLTRDWLANNINHPNDFGVRLYAQVILNTIVGNDYFIFE